MSLGHGTSIVRDGLVFHYDMGNTKKSWKGKPTENLHPDSDFSQATIFTSTAENGGWGSTFTRTIETKIGPFGQPSTVYTLKLDSTTSLYRAEGGAYEMGMPGGFTLTSGITYTISAYVKADIPDSSTNILYLLGASSSGSATMNVTTEWQRFERTFTPTVTGTYYLRHYWYDVLIDNRLYVCYPQIEESYFATPYVNGTRSNTEAILDLTKNSTITANSLTYNSDGSFEFDGSSDYISSTMTSLIGTESFSVSVWVRLNSLPITNPRVVSLGTDSSNYFNLGTYGGNSPSSYSCFWFEVKKGGTYYLGFHDVNRKYETDIWYNLVGVFNNDTNNGALYINGENVTGSGVGGGAPNVFNQLLVGTNTTSPSEVIDGDIPECKFYNKALTSDEVKQNFNATRWRYGI